VIFKTNHIKIIFESSKIRFLIENEEVGGIPYDCMMFQDKNNLNKENFDAIYQVLEKEFKGITKGFILQPILKMDISDIEEGVFSKLHYQFF